MKNGKGITAPEQMQRVVRIVHWAAPRGNTVAMYWQPDGSHELHAIKWSDDRDDKIIVGGFYNVERIVLPMMNNVTGVRFCLVGTNDLGMSTWERLDYIANKPRQEIEIKPPA